MKEIMVIWWYNCTFTSKSNPILLTFSVSHLLYPDKSVFFFLFFVSYCIIF